jgi:lambda family phage tail tape measure protein
MAKDLSAQLSITAEASGVEAGVGRAKKSLADLGATAATAGKTASEGLGSIGAAAQESAQKAEMSWTQFLKGRMGPAMKEFAGDHSQAIKKLAADWAEYKRTGQAAMSGAAGQGLKAVGDGADGASKKVDAATRSMINSIQRTTAALDAGGRSSSKYFEILASQRGVSTESLKPYLTQLDAVAAKQALAGSALAKGTIQFNEYGLSAKQTTAALRQVPAQLTDIFVSLQGGQAPLTVLLQQGGQLRDIFGGIAPAARALGGALLRLINPFTIAASVAIALGAAYNAGSKEADAYARAIIFSGNAAGTTIGNLQSMAKSISQVAGTQGNAAAALAAFAESGDVAGRSLQRVALAAIQLERAGGQAVAKTVEQFSALAKDPLTASIKLNESTRFLTLSVYQQIKALEEQGKTVEAATVAQEAYANSITDRSAEVTARLGLIERAWLAIKDATKSAIDATLNIGRADTNNSLLADAQKRLSDLRTKGAQGLFGEPLGKSATDSQIAAEQANIAALSRRIVLEGEVATSAKAAGDQVKARIDFDKEGNKYLSDKVRLERALTEARNLGAAAGASQQEIEKRQAAIRESFAKKIPKGPKPEDSGTAALAELIAQQKNLLEEEVNGYKNRESILEATRSAGLISEKSYYDQKREFIELNTTAQENALIGQIAALEVENARIAGQKGKDREYINNRRAIADAESKLSTIQADAATRITILNIQQEASIKRLGLAYLSARQAAQDYFDQTERQQQRDLDAFGQGGRQRQFNSGIAQIEDRFAGQRRDLENQKAQLEFEGRFTDEARKQYEQRLSIINEFQQKSLDSFSTYYDKLLKKQGDFNVGANEALADYIDGVANVAKDTEALFSKAFDGLEDVLTDFVTTGKGSFKELAQSISADINRILIRQNITGPLAEMIQGGFKSGDGVGGAIQGFLGRILPGSGQANAASAQAGATAAITSAQASSAASIVAANTANTTAITTAIASSTTAIVNAISLGSPTAAGGGSFSLDGIFGAVEGSTGEAAAASELFATETATATAATAGLADAGLAAAASLAGMGPIIAGIGAMLSLTGGQAGGAVGLLQATGGQVGGLAGLFQSGNGGSGGFAGLLGGLFGFASGGRPPMGRPSIVGEQGMELFIPDTPGRILSAADTKAALANSGTVERRPINVTVQQSFAPGTSRQTVDQAAAAAGRRVREQLARATA